MERNGKYSMALRQSKKSGDKFWTDVLYHVHIEQEDPNQPNFWWQAGDLDLSDNDPVTSWTDSISDITLSQVSSGGIVYKTNVINNQPTVRFSSSNYFLGNLGFDNSNPYSIFIVFKQTSVSGSITNAPAVALSFGNGSGGYPTFWTGYTGPGVGNLYLSVSQSYSDLIDSGVFGDTNPHLVEGISDTNNLTGYNAGVQFGQYALLAGDHGPIISVGNYNGAGFPWVGDIAEIMIFNTAVSNAVRIAVETYLINKYDL